MSWSVVYTKQAQKDARKIASSNLRPQAQRLLDILPMNLSFRRAEFQEALDCFPQEVRDSCNSSLRFKGAKRAKIRSDLAENPFQNPPPYEKLVGDLAGAYSRRINIQHL